MVTSEIHIGFQAHLRLFKGLHNMLDLLVTTQACFFAIFVDSS